MSDLTITHAGISVTPSVKSGEFFTADRKLNQMRVSLIDAELTTVAAAIANNEAILMYDNTDISDAESVVIGNSVSDLDATGASVLGVVTIADWANHVDFTTCTRTNVGLIIKAAADTKDIWVHAINRSGGNFTPTATNDLHLRVGIMKD